MRETELSDAQIERNDEIYNAAFEFIKVLTEKENLAWDMEYIGEIADAAADILCGMGFRIRFPALVEEPDGSQRSCDYYEPSVKRQDAAVKGQAENTIRPLTVEERKYTYAQSQQIRGQTGSIGHLRGDFGSSGESFYTTWDEHNGRLKTPAFSAELDDVINELRSDACGLLKSRRCMVDYVRKHPDSSYKGSYTTEYGFRVDTEQYAYLLRCNPAQGNYNFYCFCYQREWLDRHIERARQDIRFIDSGYRELFRLPDGEQVTITASDGQKQDFICRYIDEAHLEVGNNLYHICEFAERMEKSGCTYEPKEMPLPRECMSTLPSSGEMIRVTRYEKGYTPRTTGKSPEENRALTDRYNERNGVSRAQEAAMLAGSMFGWDTPAAKPKNYDENGKAIRPKEKER